MIVVIYLYALGHPPAFFIFRIFDIWKPFPIRYFDTHIKNGFGVMFDDALAAVYSIALIQGLVWMISKL